MKVGSGNEVYVPPPETEGSELFWVRNIVIDRTIFDESLRPELLGAWENCFIMQHGATKKRFGPSLDEMNDAAYYVLAITTQSSGI